MLTLTFLGVGSAFAKRNFQSNALIETWSIGPQRQPSPDEALLIDFGSTGPLALYQLKNVPGFQYLDAGGKIKYSAIRRVFVTHLHNDHIGGLEELAITSRYASGEGPGAAGHRPQLIAPEEVINALWENSLKGGLGAHHGGRAELADYFDVRPLRRREGDTFDSFELAGRYRLTPFATHHIQIEQPGDWPSCGLVIGDETGDESVMYSADTRFDYERLRPLMEAAGLIFHEVQLETQPDPVHTLLSDLRTLPADIRKKMLLYHYSDAWDSPMYAFVETEFAGFARPFHRYTLFPGA